MPVELNISPDDINRYVADQVINSAIGTALKAVIDEKVKELSRSYNNPLHAVIEREITAIAANLIRQKHQETIEAEVVKVVASTITSEFVSNLIEEAFTKKWN